MKEQFIARQHSKLLDAAEAIRLDPDKIEAAFIARQLVQATLPHRNPGSVPLWKRTNGNLTLAIQQGMNIETGKGYGYPYGTLLRLLLFWITTEAAKTKNPRLELGNSLASFMRQPGLDPGREGSAAMQYAYAIRCNDYSRRPSVSTRSARKGDEKPMPGWI